jgi:hypothetical protein
LQKVKYILIISLLIYGCSATKKLSDIKNDVNNNSDNDNVLIKTLNNNITDKSFYIKRADIEVKSELGSFSFIGNIKHLAPDKYLISIKNKAGIEGARIYMNSDSVLINDTFNKRLYRADSFSLRNKFGFSINMIPLIFGDLIIDGKMKNRKISCRNKYSELRSIVKGEILNYEINCEKNKAIKIRNTDNLGRSIISFEYTGFKRSNNLIIPELIKIIEEKNNLTLNIKIKKIEFPWTGNINFIPGKGYEASEL